jgi:hypothetical protein
VTVCDVTPLPLNVIVAVRAVPVFAVAVMVTVLLLLPDDAESVAQEAELLAVQLILDVTVTVDVPPEEAMFAVDGETVRVGVGEGVSAACVSVTVCEESPLPLIVSVAVRAAPVFAVAVTVTEPLLLPDDAESVAQEAELLAVQLMLDVTVTVDVPPEAAMLAVDGETVKVGVGEDVPAACVTVTVCDVTPLPLNVIVAVRAAPVFAAAVMVTEPLLLPDDAESVAQEAELLAVQLILDVTAMPAVPPDAVMFAVDGESDRVY